MILHFVRSIRGLQNFLTIPIMNSLVGFMIKDPYLIAAYICSIFSVCMVVVDISIQAACNN